MTADEIQQWLSTKIAGTLHLPIDELDRGRPLSEFGLSSEQAIALSGELERLLKRQLGAELIYDHPTIYALASYLSQDAPDVEAQPSGVGGEPIAIVGIGCRFPGAGVGPKRFFDFLSEGGDAIREVPRERWNASEFYDPDPEAVGKACTKWGAFLEEIDLFDPTAFSISPAEAASIDPQQRLLLEAAWHAFEDGGLALPDLRGSRTGVFVGISQNEYSRHRFEDPAMFDAAVPTGNALSIAANRISYVFDLQGPSMAIDTACSSSLMAVHLACRSLRAGECAAALAGGVNVLLAPDLAIAFTRIGVMAPDGRCKPFDDRADGYVRGEGVGLVLLKRRSDALRDGNPIYAQILGTATGQDGRSNGMLAPKGSAQEAVITAACSDAGVSPTEISYVETHGTGTALGDVIEAAALSKTVRPDGPINTACVIGSVKSNIGHLESAAGIAGLIKTALCLHEKVIVPSLHFETPNRAIPFEQMGLEVAASKQPWPKVPRRIAGISSFGFGGSNVHAVLSEESTEDCSSSNAGDGFLLGLSGHDRSSLARLSNAFAGALERSGETGRGLVAAANGRSGRRWRVAVQGRSASDIAKALRAQTDTYSDGGELLGGTDSTTRTAFVFSGQVSLWEGLGRDLFQLNETYRKRLLECDEALRPHLGESALPALFSEEAEALLARTEWAQPALFAVQVSIASLLQTWGLGPHACVGHSVGEVAAACVAGRLTLDDAARLIVIRGQSMADRHGHGRMAILLVSQNQAAELLAPHADSVSIAALNGPRATVISGEARSIKVVAEEALRRGWEMHWLPVDYGSHSAQMDVPASRLLSTLHPLQYVEGPVQLFSTVRARPSGPEIANPAYWAQNLRSPVRFVETIDAMLAAGIRAFVEVSPHAVLFRDIRAILTEAGTAGTVVPVMRREQTAAQTLPAAAVQLYEAGSLLKLTNVSPSPRALAAPPYEWGSKARFWIENTTKVGQSRLRAFLHDPVELAADPDRMVWQGAISTAEAPFLQDHRVLDEVVIPASAYVDMFLRVGEDVFGSQPYALEDVHFLRLVVIPDGMAVEVQVSTKQIERGRIEITIYTRTGASGKKWILTARTKAGFSSAEPIRISVDAIRSRCFDQYPQPVFYEYLANMGLNYGRRFRVVQTVWARKGEALAQLSTPSGLKLNSRFHAAHPTLVDGAFHPLAATFGARDLREADGTPFVPRSIDRVIVHAGRCEEVWSYCTLKDRSAGRAKGDVFLLDENGRSLISFLGFDVRGSRSEVAADQAVRGAVAEWLYKVEWVRAPELSGETANERPLRNPIVLCDAVGLGDALVRCWEGIGLHCVIVRRGERAERLSENEFVVRRGNVGDLRVILQAMRTADCSDIVHFWNLDQAGIGTARGADEAVDAAAAVVELVQAIETSGLPVRPRVTVVTVGGTPVGFDTPNPLQASVWGLSRALVFEHPDLNFRAIDLEITQEALIEQLPLLRTELEAPDSENQVAIRNAGRWVPRLERERSEALPLQLRRDASYLISGGRGALGAQVARKLAELGAGAVVLAGRTAAQGHDWIEEHSLAGETRFIQARCDVANPTDVEALMRRMSEELPPLRGVIHAAGLLDDGPILTLSRAQLESVMRPKVHGAVCLLQATVKTEVDFFILFSSAASVLGAPGQAGYCAANACLDALAVHERARGRPVLSISWAAWSGGGMAAGIEQHDRLVSSGLVTMIAPEIGTELCARLLALDGAHVAVLPFNVAPLIQFYPSSAGLTFFSSILSNKTITIRSDGAGGSIQRRPDIGTPYIAPRTELEESIVGVWQRALGMTGVGVEDELFALGGDSVLASRILTQISQMYGAQIEPEAAFALFTPERLAQIVDENLLRSLDDLDDNQVEQLLKESSTGDTSDNTLEV